MPIIKKTKKQSITKTILSSQEKKNPQNKTHDPTPQYPIPFQTPPPRTSPHHIRKPYAAQPPPRIRFIDLPVGGGTTCSVQNVISRYISFRDDKSECCAKACGMLGFQISMCFYCRLFDLRWVFDGMAFGWAITYCIDARHHYSYSGEQERRGLVLLMA